MINGIFDIILPQYKTIKVRLAAEPKTFLGEADGRLITNDLSFFVTIGTALGAPRDAMERITNPHWFYDELTDLWWHEDTEGRQRYRQYVLGILHPDTITVSPDWHWQQTLKNAANFWVNEVEQCVVDGEKRGFAVYLIH